MYILYIHFKKKFDSTALISCFALFTFYLKLLIFLKCHFLLKIAITNNTLNESNWKALIVISFNKHCSVHFLQSHWLRHVICWFKCRIASLNMRGTIKWNIFLTEINITNLNKLCEIEIWWDISAFLTCTYIADHAAAVVDIGYIELFDIINK